MLPLTFWCVSEQQAAAQSKQRKAGGSIAAPRFSLHFSVTLLKKIARKKRKKIKMLYLSENFIRATMR